MKNEEKYEEEFLIDSWEEDALEIEEEYEEEDSKEDFERKKKIRKNSRRAKY